MERATWNKEPEVPYRLPVNVNEVVIFAFDIPHHDTEKGPIPNTSIQHRPLLHYKGAIPVSADAAKIERHLHEVAVVKAFGRFKMCVKTHFHSNSHQVLCVSSGAGNICFGGEGNPGRVVLSVKKGDVIIVPAGVGQKLIMDSDHDDLELVLAFFPGRKWDDMCFGFHQEDHRLPAISQVPWFTICPIFETKSIANWTVAAGEYGVPRFLANRVVGRGTSH